jgi:hypothetical protein
MRRFGRTGREPFHARRGQVRERQGGTDEDLVSVNLRSNVVPQMRPEGAVERLIRRGEP